MPKGTAHKDIKIPACHSAFRTLIKNMSGDDLKRLSKEQLHTLYDRAKQAYPNRGVGHISGKEREILYIIQERLFGGVDGKTRASLQTIGETLVKRPHRRTKAIGYTLPNCGAILVKHWKGKRLEVKIVGAGFEYNGESYKSLSKLAKQITGYAVSGPIFFGLRKPKMKVATS